MQNSGYTGYVGCSAIAQSWRASNQANVEHVDVVIKPERGPAYGPNTRIEFYIPPIHAWITDVILAWRVYIPPVVQSGTTFYDFEPAGGVGGFAFIKQIVLMDGRGRQIEVMTQPNLWMVNRQMMKIPLGQMNVLKNISGMGTHIWTLSAADQDPDDKKFNPYDGFYCELPLRYILGSFASPDAVANAFAQGIKIHIYTEEGPRAIRVQRFEMMNVEVLSASYPSNWSTDPPTGSPAATPNSMLSFYVDEKMRILNRAGASFPNGLPAPLDASNPVTTLYNDLGDPGTTNITIFSNMLMVPSEFITAVFSTVQEPVLAGSTTPLLAGLLAEDFEGYNTKPYSASIPASGIPWSMVLSLAVVDGQDHTSVAPKGLIDPKLKALWSDAGSLWFIRNPIANCQRAATYQITYPELIVRRVFIPAQYAVKLGQDASGEGLQQWVNVRINQQTPVTRGDAMLVTFDFRYSQQWCSSLYCIPTVMGVTTSMGATPDEDEWLLDPLVANGMDKYLEYYFKIKGEPVPLQPIPMVANLDQAQYFWELAGAFQADGEELRNLLWCRQGKGGCIARALGDRGYCFNAINAAPFSIVAQKKFPTGFGGEIWNIYMTTRQLNLWKTYGVDIVVQTPMRAGVGMA